MAREIQVRLSDDMRIAPAEMSVPGNVPITFVVTNVGQNEHQFYLGDEGMQAHHELEMAASAPPHEHPNAVTVSPGQTETLTFTFRPAWRRWLAACHIDGHYGQGMHATISITE